MLIFYQWKWSNLIGWGALAFRAGRFFASGPLWNATARCEGNNVREKLRSETIFKRNNLPKTIEKHSLTIVRIRKWIVSSPKDVILSTMFTRIDNILIKMRLKVGKLFDMYKTYVEKTIYFLNAHIFGHLRAKKLQLKQIL
jgi:hypothetical protein